MIAALGWIGSGLVVASLLQRDLRRLRRTNLAASVTLGVFNLALGIASMIVLNVVLAAINVYELRRASTGDGDELTASEPGRGNDRADDSTTRVERYSATSGSGRPTAGAALM